MKTWGTSSEFYKPVNNLIKAVTYRQDTRRDFEINQLENNVPILFIILLLAKPINNKLSKAKKEKNVNYVINLHHILHLIKTIQNSSVIWPLPQLSCMLPHY